MTAERLRAELLSILSPVREQRIWRFRLGGDSERGKSETLFLARERRFARSKKRTNAGCRFVRSTSGNFCFLSRSPSRQSAISRQALFDKRQVNRSAICTGAENQDYLCWLVTGPLNLNGPYQICEVAMAMISGQSLKCRHKKFNKGDKYDNTAHSQKI